MKTIRQLTLTVITALFVVTAALLWASASPKVTGQTTSPFAFAPGAPTDLKRSAGPLAFLEGLFEGPWRGFDTGTFGQRFRPEIICCGRSGWRRRPRYFGRRQLFWFAGHFCFEEQRRSNFCRAGLLFTSSESNSRRSGPFGFRFRWRSRRVCNDPRRFRSIDEDHGLAQ